MYSIAILFFIVLIIQVPERAQFRHHKHRHRHDLACKQCPPGHYVQVKCNQTIGLSGQHHCAPCPPNSYSSHNSYQTECETCSRCGAGLYIWHRCTPLSDTVCNSCQTQRLDVRNEDFKRKCE